MRPVGLDRRSGKGLVPVHECVACGGRRVNRIARDTVQPDAVDAIAALMRTAG
jgi:hypothetical protein